ncbi:MAG: vanadium-dependent haloperoxidase [Acidimicrobiales bacterium]
MRRRTFLGAVAGAAGAAATAPFRLAWAAAAPPRVTPHDEDGAVVVAWIGMARSLVRATPGFTPPVASRAFGYAGVALYEAVVPGMPDHRNLGGVLTGLAPSLPPARDAAYDWGAVANAALAHIVRLLFPSAPAAQLAAVDALEAEWAAHFAAGTPRGVVTRSVERGRAVSAAVFEWSRSDGGHEGYNRNFPADYVPPTGPGLWRPTPPAFQRAMQPRWGANRPFAAADADLGHPGPPIPFSTDPGSACYAEAMEVYDTVNGLSDEQRTIARFWADDPGITATPGGHAMSILAQALALTDASLATAAEGIAKVGIAITDAFICCWKVKFTYNVLRPITYINDHIDPGFGAAMPLVTPPFPEYTSGHSVQSSAAATVLTDLFGWLAFVDHTHDDHGLSPRRFSSFEAAAAEASISRLYGGIHYRSAIMRGAAQGRAIGERVNSLPFS